MHNIYHFFNILFFIYCYIFLVYLISYTNRFETSLLFSSWSVIPKSAKFPKMSWISKRSRSSSPWRNLVMSWALWKPISCKVIPLHLWESLNKSQEILVSIFYTYKSLYSFMILFLFITFIKIATNRLTQIANRVPTLSEIPGKLLESEIFTLGLWKTLGIQLRLMGKVVDYL